MFLGVEEVAIEETNEPILIVDDAWNCLFWGLALQYSSYIDDIEALGIPSEICIAESQDRIHNYQKKIVILPQIRLWRKDLRLMDP